jgi:hypothetical protein
MRLRLSAATMRAAYGARTAHGVFTRVAQRLLAPTAAVWRNWAINEATPESSHPSPRPAQRRKAPTPDRRTSGERTRPLTKGGSTQGLGICP